jgi:hypothetical protein
MTTNCNLCTGALDEGAVYCRCGGHFHEECMAQHEDWCPRAGTDRWLGAMEL